MDPIAEALHAAADKTNDAYDHDELHAAGAIVQLSSSEPFNHQYIGRWIEGLLHRIEDDQAHPARPNRYRLAWLSARRRARYGMQAFLAEAAAVRQLEELLGNRQKAHAQTSVQAFLAQAPGQPDGGAGQ